ncbi:MAG: ParA family protein [Fretibacterium sp.]|nr:ParA family protein [Fretibacterium sp.]
MLTVGFCNLKGGVGKTTACQNIAVALARAGKRVAVLDMDPQSNLSASFGISVAPGAPHIFDLLSRDARWDEVVVCREGVDVVPSTLDLVMVELRPEGAIGQDSLLREALDLVAPERYDFILLDSPPQLGVFTRNVLTASDRLLVPMDGGFYSLAGLRLLNEAIPLFRERLNPRLSLLGVLMTRHNPNLFISREVAGEVLNFFGNLFFSSYVRQNVSLIEASSLGMSVFAYDPASNGARDYERVATEFLERCEHHG